MRDIGQEALESGRPGIEVDDAISHCLTRLYRTRAKGVMDEVCEGLTFEELIGALLLASDALEELEEREP